MADKEINPRPGKSDKLRHDGTEATVSPDFIHYQDASSPTSRRNTKPRRARKACQRCRMKKIKCNGEFPCPSCKSKHLVCIAGNSKKLEFKQCPRGYAELLEINQLVLVAIVHKLYDMVRDGAGWDLGEPERNDNGVSVIHDIASKLCVVQLNSDGDPPLPVLFPRNEADMAELAGRLAGTSSHQYPSPSLETGLTRLDLASSHLAVADDSTDPPAQWIEAVFQRTQELHDTVADQASRLQLLQSQQEQLHQLVQSQQEQLHQMLAWEQMQQTMIPGIGGNTLAMEPYVLPHSSNPDPTTILMDNPGTYHNFGYNTEQ